MNPLEKDTRNSGCPNSRHHQQGPEDCLCSHIIICPGVLSSLPLWSDDLWGTQRVANDPRNTMRHPSRTPLLRELKESLRRISHENLKGLYLYGSYAYQNEDAESDLERSADVK